MVLNAEPRIICISFSCITFCLTNVSLHRHARKTERTFHTWKIPGRETAPCLLLPSNSILRCLSLSLSHTHRRCQLILSIPSIICKHKRNQRPYFLSFFHYKIVLILFIFSCRFIFEPQRQNLSLLFNNYNEKHSILLQRTCNQSV